MDEPTVPRGKRPRVKVSMDDKERAIARIRKGETKAGISRELGVPESTVRGWVKRADQRKAREAFEENTPSAILSSQVPVKRDHNGQQIVGKTLTGTMPVPMQLFQQAADSQLQLNGWLHIFNAGILNFTLIATAASLRARVRGTSERLSLWQIICDYVDEAGRNVVANGGQYVAPSTSNQQRQLNSPTRLRGNGFVAPRLHITAEDDEDDVDGDGNVDGDGDGDGDIDANDDSDGTGEGEDESMEAEAEAEPVL
ncbi:uncharacterized protein LOC132790628 isoform X1 [Drosophila nasuta]|uniref:uncharacterized protein LOC132790628 isoform X1 n=1 Tax=Drosophila nasuta TaxID=42062 RepID=UPI00295E8397|nr:uncharacterized protein LOC132790628 isoform X1 [Drosophila nasuta]